MLHAPIINSSPPCFLLFSNIKYRHWTAQKQKSRKYFAWMEARISIWHLVGFLVGFPSVSRKYTHHLQILSLNKEKSTRNLCSGGSAPRVEAGNIGAGRCPRTPASTSVNESRTGQNKGRLSLREHSQECQKLSLREQKPCWRVSTCAQSWGEHPWNDLWL